MAQTLAKMDHSTIAKVLRSLERTSNFSSPPRTQAGLIAGSGQRERSQPHKGMTAVSARDSPPPQSSGSAEAKRRSEGRRTRIQRTRVRREEHNGQTRSRHRTIARNSTSGHTSLKGRGLPRHSRGRTYKILCKYACATTRKRAQTRKATYPGRKRPSPRGKVRGLHSNPPL